MEALVMETLSKEPEKRPTAQQLEAALIDIQFQLEGAIIDITKENTQALNYIDASHFLSTLREASTQVLAQETSKHDLDNQPFQETKAFLVEVKKVNESSN
jgi:hypothetical protein